MSEEIKIEVSTTADIKALMETVLALGEQVNRMKAAGQATDELRAKLQGITDDYRKFHDALGDFANAEQDALRDGLEQAIEQGYGIKIADSNSNAKPKSGNAQGSGLTDAQKASAESGRQITIDHTEKLRLEGAAIQAQEAADARRADYAERVRQSREEDAPGIAAAAAKEAATALKEAEAAAKALAKEQEKLAKEAAAAEAAISDETKAIDRQATAAMEVSRAIDAVVALQAKQTAAQEAAASATTPDKQLEAVREEEQVLVELGAAYDTLTTAQEAYVGASIDITTPEQLKSTKELLDLKAQELEKLAAGTDAHAQAQKEYDGLALSLHSNNAGLVEQLVLLEKEEAALQGTANAAMIAANAQAQLNIQRQLPPPPTPPTPPPPPPPGGGGGGGVLGDLLGEIPGGQALAKLASGPVGALAIVGGGIATAIGQYAEAELAITKLDAALAQNGLLTNENREKYAELASQLQETTGVAQGEWMGVLTRLTQFGSNPQTLGIDTEAVKNLAGLMGGDVQQAANAYTRALQGNFEMFSRYGIVLEKTGTQTEKLQKLQEQLAQRGGGQLEASSKTLIGQWGTLKNNTSDLMEALGGFFQKALGGSDILYGLSTSAAWLAKQFASVIPSVEGMDNKTASLARSALEAEENTKQLAEREKDLKKSLDDTATAFGRESSAIAQNLAFKNQLLDSNMRLAILKIKDENLPPEIEAQKIAALQLHGEAEKEKFAIDAKQKEVALAEKAMAQRLKAIKDAKDEKTAADADVDKGAKLDKDAEQPLEQAKNKVRAAYADKEKAQDEYDELEYIAGTAYARESVEGKRLQEKIKIADDYAKLKNQELIRADEAAKKARTEAGLPGKAVGLQS